MGATCKRLRQLLNNPGIIRSLGAHDVFTARMVELAGLETVFIGGFGVSASMLGYPDVGLTTLTEMTDAVARMSKRVNIPVVADGDTGHGDIHNVARTVKEFEAAGAAGILLEDQTNPKRCGHFSGKQIVPVIEWLDRLKAALDARTDPNFVIIARTDSLAIEGLDASINRANLAAEAGADVCFIEAPQSLAQLEAIPKAVKKPLLVNMLTGGVTPILTANDLEKLGYKIVVCPIESLMVAGAAIRQLVNTFLRTGRVDSPESGSMLSFKELKDILGLAQIGDLKERIDK